MFGTLPDLTPRDSHSLWYSSSRSPAHLGGAPHDALPPDQDSSQQGHGPSRQRGQQLLERTSLHRLATDEFWIARRKHNVANFGSHWLKPPGIPKTLHQLREERREQEEHQEAMRREQLAQELAEAEAEGLPEDGGMDDVQLDGAPDLDDDIPEATDDFFMEAGDDDDEDNEDEVEDDDSVGEEADRQDDMVAARMRMTDDAFREALIRGDPDGDDMYGHDEELHEESQGHMLDEDDLGHHHIDDDGAGIDMDANLDDDIPEAASEMYEHTDSDAELSSSSRSYESDDGAEDQQDDDEGGPQDIGFAPRAAPLGPPQSPTLRGLSAPRHSMELSGFLSQDESSFMDSSPAQARRARHG